MTSLTLHNCRHTYNIPCCFVRSGAVDSIVGAVRNPWGYPYNRLGETSSDSGRQVAFWNDVNGEATPTSRATESPDTPLDWHIAGGSSGGCAAAVAAGISLA